MIARSCELAVFDQPSRMLDEAKSLEEIKFIRNSAEAARNCTKAAKLGLQLQNRSGGCRAATDGRAGGLPRSIMLGGELEIKFVGY